MLPSVLSAFLGGLLTTYSSLGVSASHAQDDDALPWRQLVAFGDSYSDSCNAERHDDPAGYASYPWPSCPAPNATDRYIEGATWPEWLRYHSGEVDRPSSPPAQKQLQPGQWNITVLAQGGATCSNLLFPKAERPDLGQQIDLFLTDYNTTSPTSRLPSFASKDSVATIWIGANDFAFISGLFSGGNGTLTDFEDCVVGRFQKLHDVGFRNFIWFEVPALQYAPFYSSPASLAQNITALVNRSNAKISSKLRRFQSSNKGTRVAIFPARKLFESFVHNPAKWGLVNVTSPCSPNYDNFTQDRCDDPDKYLWANSVHPSSHIMNIVSGKVQSILNEL